MPITADLNGKNYVLGRGKVFFGRFPANAIVNAALQSEGRRYIGNTPEFTTTSTSEDLDHYDSDNGVRVKDDSVQLSFDRSGSMTCDNIDKPNVALYFLGDESTVAQASATGVTSTATAKRARFYQLGSTPQLPSGVRNVSNVVVKKGVAFADTVTAAGNYEVDEISGQVYIEADAPDIPDNTPIQITFDVAASTYGQVISKNQALYGELFFQSNNPKGPNRDFFFPYVKLSPDGDYNLKGDDWQTMGFTFEILKKASNIEAVYITERPVTV